MAGAYPPRPVHEVEPLMRISGLEPLNYTLGATDMKKYIANLSACADCFVFCYPNAGLPNAMGGYDQKGPEMAEEIRPFCEENLVNAIGGCCGSTPEHIAAIAAMAGAYPPRPVHEVEPLMRISGLEPLNYTPDASNMRSTFLNIGERCNVAGSIMFKKAVINNDYDTALAIALKQKGPEMAEEIRPFCEENLVNAIGGCCGSTPEHIAAIAAMAGAYPPRPVHEVEPLMRISGLEPLNYTPDAANMRSTFLNIGERCNVAGSIMFKKAVINNDYDTALAIALKQVQQGAHVLDINMDDGLIDGVAAMTKFVNLCIAAMAGAYPPRPVHEVEPLMRISGLEPLNYTPDAANMRSTFLNIGERCNVAGSIMFKKAVINNDYDTALAIALKQVQQGAHVLDINMDDGLIDGVAAMTKFVNLCIADPEISRVPFMIDSSKFHIVEAGLKCAQGKCIVNSISMKEGEAKFREQATIVKNHGAAVVVMAFDESGQAAGFDDKVSMCSRAYRILVEEVGFNPQDIIFDPNILTVGTGLSEHNNYAVDFIRATREIKRVCPGSGTASATPSPWRWGSTARWAPPT
eukprot:jgi/Sobl393_1/535/SZX62690.1